MRCAVYFRLARDEDRANKEAVYNELLKAFGYRIPMRTSSVVTSAIHYAADSVDPQRGETPQQAAERIKRKLVMNDLLRSTQSTVPSPLCEFSVGVGAK